MKKLLDKLKQGLKNTNISVGEKNELLKIIDLQEKEVLKMDFKLQSLVRKNKTTESVLNNIIEEIEEKNIEIQKYANELEEANKTKDRFFSIISHDLKSPFNALIGFSDLIKIALEENDFEDIKKMNELIHQTATNTYKLLLNLLDWSRAQTNEIKFKPTKININKLIKENLELFKAQANKKGVIFEFDSPKNNFVLADENMTNIIIRNLISNAVKYTRKGSVSIVIGLTDKTCVIKITDTGIGIKQEVVKQIFNIEENISTQGTNGERGTGLGLILCKEFTNKNNGNLTVESTINKGSTSTLNLPIFKN